MTTAGSRDRAERSELLDTPEGYNAIVEQFGNLRPYVQDDGTISPEWESTMLATIALPFSIPLDWDRSVLVSKMRCHKMLAETFEEIFDQIVEQGLSASVKTYGGCYAGRTQRSSTALSTHAWGIALDLNPFENAMGTQGNMDMRLVTLFRLNGFKWGGDFVGSRCDPMHFQFATGY
jgi:D-alanyl-D-alanine carboxypeptidase-like protein